MRVSLFSVFFPLLGALKISSKSREGTETISYGLTDKQLGIQRYFAELTYLGDNQNLENWVNWGESIHDVDCDGNTCIRYEIAGLAYAAGVLGMKIPHYHQVSKEMMKNAILRMIQPEVWQYIELFNDFKDQETYPDPVAYKNIMYSGHLVQMIGMYESIFGDFTFSTNGWDFIWTNTTNNEIITIHYNTSLLMQRVYDQSLAYEISGVPCEPDSIFVICNNYPQNGWLLYDTLYHTNYTLSSIPSWSKIVKSHGINHHHSSSSTSVGQETIQDNKEKLENYFKLDYLIRPLGIWEPIASIGSDLWALGWMKTWWPYDDISSTLQPAFQFILESTCWNQITSSMKLISDTETLSSTLFPYSFLHPDEKYQKLFPFNDMITTSFYPMIEKQFLSLKESHNLGKYNEVLNYFEYNYGQDLDLTGDGIGDLYQYNSNICNDIISAGVGSSPYSSCESGNYSIWATSNLLIGMIHPVNDINYLRQLFYPFNDMIWYQQYQHHPKVDSVEYPHVMVSYAQYIAPINNHKTTTSTSSSIHNITVQLKPGDQPPINNQHLVIFSNIPSNAQNHLILQVDGLEYTNYSIFPDNTRAGTSSSTIDELIQVQVLAPGWSDTTAQQSQAITLELLYEY